MPQPSDPGASIAAAPRQSLPAPATSPASPGSRPKPAGLAVGAAAQAPAASQELPAFLPPPASEEPTPLPSGASLASWTAVPNAGKTRTTRPAATEEDPAAAEPRGRVAAERADDRIVPVPHVVRKGENFWTIARLYYNSGRFY
ncbi:MAG TPA: hypothetical protein VF590_22010, partial [Isosphaeraceae bacterium]